MRAEKGVEHESDTDTNCNLYFLDGSPPRSVKEIRRELKKLWSMKIWQIPIVISALRMVSQGQSNKLEESWKKVSNMKVILLPILIGTLWTVS